jgi:methionyl aminopeptidase
MRRAGLLVWHAHQVAAELVRPGVTTGEIDAAVDRYITDHDGIPLFKGVPGPVPFPAATCLSVNEEIVHGIPSTRRLREGDIISIDIGVRLNGWCGDAAVTRPVGQVDETCRHLLQVTEETLRLAIKLMKTRQRWSQVARGMADYVRASGLTTLEEFGGHGVGREMWENPHVPNYVERGFERSDDFPLERGLVIAVEPMVNVGTKDFKVLEDGWTVVTEDSLPSAHFEHTIAITAQGPFILTAGPNGEGWSL